jgi:hypothetical protein
LYYKEHNYTAVLFTIDLHQRAASADRRSFATEMISPLIKRRPVMKGSIIAAALLLTTAFAWAQRPAANDPHHPQDSTTQAPAQGQTSTPSQQSTGAMPMMNMMGNMPMMMDMMRSHMSMMNMMGMIGSRMGGMATIDHVEGRVAFLRTELKIADAQSGAWNTFADALRANAKRLGDVRSAMMAQREPQAPSLVDRLDLQERWLAARLDGTRAIKSAYVNLSGVLSDEQKKTANELLGPHMGMGVATGMGLGMGMEMMPGVQPGQTGSGQMGPGQMQPRRMMPSQPAPK